MNAKTKRLSLLLVVFALIGIFTLGAFAAEEKTSGDFTYVVENEAAVITAYSGDATDITVPATLGGYPVKEIGQHVFYYCTQIESLTLPEGIEKIGDYAFGGLGGLKKLKIPDSVKIIGESAFSDTAITELTVPESVETIGASAFQDCHKLKKVTISEKIEKIADYAFCRCSQLESITLPATVTEIGEGAIRDCIELESVTLPSGLKTIGESAFYGCESIKSITIPESVETIGSFAFSYTALEAVTVPEGVKTLGFGAFASSKLKSAVILCKISKIEDNLFENCGKLISVTLPDTVTEIGNRAFSSCFKLSEINLPDALKTIGNYAFDDCNALTSIVLPDKVTSIGERAFYSCSGLKLVDTGNVTKIGVEAFSDCDKLEKAIFGSKLKTINKKAFTLPLNADERIHFCYKGTKSQWKEVKINKCPYIQEGPIHFGYTDSHKLKKSVTKATLEIGGTIYEKCSVCDFKREIDSFAKPAYFTLSEESYTYNKKERTPSVTVKDTEGKKLKAGSDYTVKYESGRKLPGKYTVTITFKGNYKGTKKLYFTITLRKTEKLTASSTKTSVTLKWNKVTGADGYIVYKYNSSTKKYEVIKTVTKTSLKISNLKSGTTYKFKVRAYKKDGDTIYGAYSSVKEVTTKLSAPSKVTSKAATTSVKLTWSKSRGADGYRIYYKSGEKWKTLVKSVKGTTYTIKKLKAATKHTFAVRAYKKTKDGTIWSEYKDFSAATKPGKATLTVKSISPGAATLTWKKVTNANSYRVYYKVNKGGYKLYKTYSKPTKVTLKNLKGGDTYTFKVQAGIKVTGSTVWGEAVTKSVKVAYRTTKVLKAMKDCNYLLVTDNFHYQSQDVIAIKGNKIYISAVDSYTGERYSMIYNPTKDIWYIIWDSRGVYTIMNDSDLPEDACADYLIKSNKNTTIPTSFKTTEEWIEGYDLVCETATIDGYKTKFCYEGERLTRVETDLGNGTTLIERIDEFSTTIPDSLFMIPAGYEYVEAE